MTKQEYLEYYLQRKKDEVKFAELMLQNPENIEAFCDCGDGGFWIDFTDKMAEEYSDRNFLLQFRMK